MVDCLRTKTSTEVIEAHNKFFDWLPENQAREPMNVFSPRPDPEAEAPFLPDHPLALMEKGAINNVPYMLSYAEKEGNWRINHLTPDNPTGAKIWTEFASKADDLFPFLIGLFRTNSKDDIKTLLEKLRKFYKLEILGFFDN